MITAENKTSLPRIHTDSKTQLQIRVYPCESVENEFGFGG